MVAALVRALKSLFIAHGSKVLMTTHSPMAVAALAESEIFRVIRNGRDVRIASTSKAEAIEDLSEGIATVDAGLRIAACDDARVTILTEGHNAHHLKRWVELNFPEGVHVFDQLPQHTSKSQLLAYGRLIARMDPATHFVIVWDCDAAGEAQTLRNDLPSGAKVTPFAFRRREDNMIVRSGIENNYDDNILEPYVINRTDSCGRLLSREFNKSRKTEFAKQVRQRAAHPATSCTSRICAPSWPESLRPDRSSRDLEDGHAGRRHQPDVLSSHGRANHLSQRHEDVLLGRQAPPRGRSCDRDRGRPPGMVPPRPVPAAPEYGRAGPRSRGGIR